MTHDRVAMHGTRRSVLEAQARAAGLPLTVVPLVWPSDNETYEAVMEEALIRFHDGGVTHCAFGDLFLQDIRVYREAQVARCGLEPLFPLWGEPTRRLAARMIDGGLKAVITCVDLTRLPKSFAGRDFSHDLLNELPPGIDPCGENGEFHTCVVDGPAFGEPLEIAKGVVVERDGFGFADLELVLQ